MWKLSSFLVLLFLIPKTWAFPLYYKCGAGDRLDDSFAGPEVLDEIESLLSGELSDSEFEARATAYCLGAQNCVQELEQIKVMLDDSVDIMNAILAVKTRLQEEVARAQIDEGRYQSIKHLVDSSFTIRACHEVKKTWSPDAWSSDDGNKFAVYYPKYSNYMYATGCMGRASTAKCPGHHASTYKDKIKSALLMGMDPYLAIALVWLEGGTAEGLDYLYLDPVAKFSAMGCGGRPVSPGNAGSDTLESYGTYYNIEAETITDAALARKLGDFQRAKNGQALASGTSYFCRLVHDDLGMVYDRPQENSCCLKLPYGAASVDAPLIEEALIFEQARKIYQTRFREHQDPAFRVQRFNGYTKLMGAAEGVEAFRAGVNYYENPAYGYQAMDYMINSILPNPVFRKMVSDAEAEVKQTLGREASWRSIMCVEHPGGGHFKVDSEHYFKLHRDSSRLETIVKKWKSGEALNARESKIMEVEVVTLIERGLMPAEAMDLPLEQQLEIYFKDNHHLNRTTIGSASANQSFFTWENFKPIDLRRMGKNLIGR